MHTRISCWGKFDRCGILYHDKATITMTMRFVNIIIPCDGYEISETGSREFSGNTMEGGIWEAEGHKIREAGERDSGSGTSHLCY